MQRNLRHDTSSYAKQRHEDSHHASAASIHPSTVLCYHPSTTSQSRRLPPPMRPGIHHTRRYDGVRRSMQDMCHVCKYVMHWPTRHVVYPRILQAAHWKHEGGWMAGWMADCVCRVARSRVPTDGNYSKWHKQGGILTGERMTCKSGVFVLSTRLYRGFFHLAGVRFRSCRVNENVE